MTRPFKTNILVTDVTMTYLLTLFPQHQKSVWGTVKKRMMALLSSRADLAAGVSGPTTRPGGPGPTSWTQTSGALELAF